MIPSLSVRSRLCRRSCLITQVNSYSFLGSFVMRANEFQQARKVIRLDRIDNRRVVHRRLLLSLYRLQPDTLVALGQIIQRSDSAKDVAIAACRVHREMKSAVHLHKRIEIALDVQSQHLLIKFGDAAANGRIKIRPTLPQCQAFEFDASPVKLIHVGQRNSCDDCAAMGSQLDKAALSEPLNRLPNRMAAYVETGGQLDLVEPFVGLQLPLQDHPLELGRYVISRALESHHLHGKARCHPFDPSSRKLNELPN